MFRTENLLRQILHVQHQILANQKLQNDFMATVTTCLPKLVTVLDRLVKDDGQISPSVFSLVRLSKFMRLVRAIRAEYQKLIKVSRPTR